MYIEKLLQIPELSDHLKPIAPWKYKILNFSPEIGVFPRLTCTKCVPISFATKPMEQKVEGGESGEEGLKEAGVALK